MTEKICVYNGNSITFNVDGVVMVNATEMAKPFNKRPYDWGVLQSIREFLAVYAKTRKTVLADLVRVRHGATRTIQNCML